MTVEAAPDAAWESWLREADGEADFLQTARWASIDDAANGVRSHVLRVDASVAGLVAARTGGELRCLHGPVFSSGGAVDGIIDFAAAAVALARKRGCTSVDLIGRPPLSRVDPGALASRLTPLGFETTPWLTAVVDLRRSDEALLAAADRAVGKALRRCGREGVAVRLCEDRASYERDFLASFAATRPDYDPERGRRAFDLDGGRDYRYYVAVGTGGAVLATLGTYRYEGVATEIMSVRTAAGRAAGLPAQDLLHWQAMRDHRDLGDAWFDLAGYAVAPANEAEAGIKRFKQKWGGVEVSSPIFTKRLEGRVRRAVRKLVRGGR